MVSPAVSTNPISSSSTLWATASKEWVIAPKPKPGRKPKKDLTNPAKPEADRAFRERKQSQLAELQARVQSYEQGEIERNVALQNIAKRLKEENESLRNENALLKEKLVKSGLSPAPPPENDKKRSRGDSSSNSNPANKRAKAILDSPRLSTPPLTLSFSPSPPSTVSSPDSSGSSETGCSSLPSYDMQPDPMHTSHLLDFSPVKPTQVEDNGFPSFGCGFCTEDTTCMCRELVAQQAHAASNYDQASLSSILQSTNTIQLDQPLSSPPECILENLPPYQPPVPLRRRPVVSNVNSIFTVIPPAPLPANCSGDPSNCMACADDAFGKAFCSAIEQTVASQAPCADCPSSQDPSTLICDAQSGCCGSSSNCGCRNPTSVYQSSPPLAEGGSPETMPTNDAWRQIKSHPNVSFADLALLAEVVARRAKCTGPKVVISPALGSITPERTSSPGALDLATEQEPILLTDPHAHYREKERVRFNEPTLSSGLVPQEVLISCGRRRVREVQTDAVQAALRLLDAKFT
ncbi:hypothetical protein DXG01_000131 [Tephrocybe rancida]|nr:hypothetical protein DXG01_000131 [Tephrocybe rancida]